MIQFTARRRRSPVLATVAIAGLGLGLAPASASAATGSTSRVADAATGGADHRGHDRDDNAFAQVNLVADRPGIAPVTDPHLVNPWGLSQGPATPVWVSDNGADSSTLYTGGGAGQAPSAVPLVVSIPGGAPTGQDFNPTTSFVLPDGQPALFVFAGEDGQVSAWNRGLTPLTSAVPVASVRGGTLKGLALLPSTPHGPEILVADFAHGRIAAFDGAFRRVALPRWAFTDRRIPRGYAPFDVALLGSRVFVTYAKQDAAKEDDVAGRGHGFGRLLDRFARRGVLNSPWGLAIAPEGFGAFSGAVLVGNFGDGRIHAFDPRTGRLLGTLRDGYGRAIVIDGLWGLLPGNGTSAGTSDVWFSAGPGDETHGLLGVLRALPDPDDD
jgi:uncharacterized protein (TIGR03118 family)